MQDEVCVTALSVSRHPKPKPSRDPQRCIVSWAEQLEIQQHPFPYFERFPMDYPFFSAEATVLRSISPACLQSTNQQQLLRAQLRLVLPHKLNGV